MDEMKVNYKGRPERKIQDALTMFLRARMWYVKSTHGNAYQSGFPDLYCHHKKYGYRWIEVKNPHKYAFTDAQLENFPLMDAYGAGIWVLTAATELEYLKLWNPPNWHQFLPITKVKTRVVTKSHEYVPKFPTPGLKDKKS